MRPLTILLGILMGSAAATTFGLLGTWIVILFLPRRDVDLFAAEHTALLGTVAIFTALAAASAFSFYGDLRTRPWRLGAHALSALVLAATIWVYWPT